jgi:PAS domain S-box-containing protein
MNAAVQSMPVEDEVKKTSLPALPSMSAQAEPHLNALINILLVDDESRNLEVLDSILESPDRQLVRAQSAEAALLALIQNDFAAIVLDIQMPGMSGIELAKLIKQRKRNQHIPIIFLTAYYQEDKDVLSGYDVGAVDYLTKPVDPQILKSKVNVFVELFRSNRALAATNLSLENEIAERKQAELARDRLAAIVESSSDAILSKTLDGIITSWNQGAEKMFGHNTEEIVGRSVSLLIPADRSDELELVLERIQREEAVEPFETVRVRKDGRLVHVSLTLSPIKDEAGRIAGVSAIMQDITERKRLEAEILQVSEYEQRRIAEDLHDGLGQQLGGISFLSAVLKKNLVELASPEAEAATKISRLLTDAMAQTRSLARGLHPVTPETNGLMSALEELAVRITDLFKVSCRFKCPQPVLIENNIVATHLYRIAQEAITNAVKHGQAQQIDITLSSLPNQIILMVSDDGVGSNRTERHGKGMGLRIMHHRASMIGGTFGVQEQRGGGTKMVCTVGRNGGVNSPA